MSKAPDESWAAALAGRTGRTYWRGIEELLETPAFREAASRELPAGAADGAGTMTRRRFVQLLGASAALAGAGGCMEPPNEEILPYVVQPPEVTPGIPRYYATSMVVGGYATGLLVESHAGRPTKVEGNPDHPASLGASGVYEQASVLQLYDPQRARGSRRGREPSSFAAFVRAFHPQLPEHGRPPGRAAAPRPQGAGLRFLLEPTSSPLVAHLITRLREAYPEARPYFYGPLDSQAPAEGARIALGRPLETQLDFRQAAVVLALDADILGSAPFHLRYSRHFAERRRIREPSGSMSRLYVVEPMPSVTGSMADHRLAVPARDVADVLAAVLGEVMTGGGAQPAGMPGDLAPTIERLRARPAPRDLVRAIARDLRAHAGRSLVVVGERQPAIAHAMAHVLNAALGNVGRTVWYTEPPVLETGTPSRTLGPLVEEIRAGEIDTLVVLEGNPSYAAPADVEFSRWLRRVPDTVYVGLYENETARDCRWFLPGTHYLEAWGDARARDGTLSLVQPLVNPLFGGKTPAEVLAAFLGEADRGARQLLVDFHQQTFEGTDFERFWAEALGRGLVAGSDFPRVGAALEWQTLAASLRAALLDRPPTAPPALEANFLQDASVYDGRFTNNAWLLELPDPVTKLTWDNAALVSPATARRLGVESEVLLELRYLGRRMRMPALVLPGHADDSVSLHFGYGREGAERLARGVGFNVYRIWTSGETPYFGTGLTVSTVFETAAEHLPTAIRARRPARHPLALTQTHWSMQGRPIALSATLEEYRRNPDFTAEQSGPVASLYEPFRYSGDQWAMAIDMNICTGCSACVIACQAENNTPVVGKAGVLKSREMHWLRIDRYYTGEQPESPTRIVSQPMLCQHCEKAPCEYVCPVNATVHSPDGLNEMIYNRCIGTRFCSNNCPYKVRRFNWFNYNADKGPLERMPMNPDVTVRARGVMEKCTYCVQRIRRAEIAARVAGRALRDGEFTTACAQACPTGAIVFGSLGDPDSAVSRLHQQRLAYAVLHELGTRPRTRYLPRLVNRNEELV